MLIDDVTHVKCAFAAKLQVFTSSDTLISGVLGPCTADIPNSLDQTNQKDSAAAAAAKSKNKGNMNSKHSLT